ncbi:ScbR family autoregulator-binding transcription factor [Streptomyces sp. NPDC048290]|uniref:ScbR family autoregulator-binding transcription factor n=1 Tax=Streptomyces sp. NPDC048290 TaxID=3155811 RepID=UPI00343B1CFF
MQGKSTRQTLLEAAAKLFDERGYAGTSISDISAVSGRTSGAIYFHYTNKEQLAVAVVEEHFASWPRMIERHRTTGRPALEKLVALSFTVARAFRDDIVVRAGSRLWMERKAIAAPLPTPFLNWIGVVTELLKEAAAEGELAPGVDPVGAGHSVVSAFFGLHTVSDALDDRARIEQRLHDLWLLLLRALQARPDPVGLLDRVRDELGAAVAK